VFQSGNLLLQPLQVLLDKLTLGTQFFEQPIHAGSVSRVKDESKPFITGSAHVLSGWFNLYFLSGGGRAVIKNPAP